MVHMIWYLLMLAQVRPRPKTSYCPVLPSLTLLHDYYWSVTTMCPDELSKLGIHNRILQSDAISCESVMDYHVLWWIHTGWIPEISAATPRDTGHKWFAAILPGPYIVTWLEYTGTSRAALTGQWPHWCIVTTHDSTTHCVKCTISYISVANKRCPTLSAIKAGNL